VASSCAWSFDNEYQYGDFGGNAIEMLRRGYDLHLHYANFGVRTLLIRLPHGLPNPRAVEPYYDAEAIQFIKDKKGPGGVLAIEPCFEPDALEELWDIDDLLDCLAPLRGEILAGDLRPLYLAHLGFTHSPLWLLGAMVASFYVFLTALRQVHNAFHYTLGLPRPATEVWMFLNTVLLMGWMHAVQTTHLLHHRRCLAADRR
jgi:hypothetical protein